MRLIDADKLIVLIDEQKGKETGSYTKGLNKGLSIAKSIINDETQTPISYDMDKVVEELEEEREHSHADFEQYAELHGIDSEDDWFYAGLKRAIVIVKVGGINEKSN